MRLDQDPGEKKCEEEEDLPSLMFRQKLNCPSGRLERWSNIFGDAKPMFFSTHIRIAHPCLTDLARILAEEQDSGAHHYIIPGTVPIKERNLGFWVPMHFLY